MMIRHPLALKLAVLLFCGAAAAAGAQTVMTVDDIAAYALEHSRDISAAVDALEDARETLDEVFVLDDSSVSISSGYNYSSLPAAQQHSVNLDGSVTVPIIPEVSVSANLNETFGDEKDPSGSLRVNYSPFAGNSTEWRDFETFRKAEITLQNLHNTVGMNAEEAALDLIKGQLNVVSAERSMALEEQKYEIAKKRYELDDMTYTELQDAGSDLGSARQKYYDAQKSLLALKKNLYQLIGPDLGDVEVYELDAEEVMLMVDARDSELASMADVSPSTISLLNMAVELEALNSQLEATPVFEPNLSVSASVNYFDFRAGTSITFSISPNDFNDDERADIQDSIDDKKLDLQLEQATLELEIRMLEQSISVSREALEISLSDYETSKIQFEETEYLYKVGERTAVELAETELSLFAAHIRVFTSATDLYKNLGDLLLLYRNG